MEASQGKGHVRLADGVQGPITALLAGHVPAASSAIPEQHYYLPLLYPEGDQLNVTKGKMRRKKNILAISLLRGSTRTAASGFSSYLLEKDLLGNDKHSPAL